MFGNHDYKTARRIADAKTLETGKPHTVLPSPDKKGKWTIGAPIKALSGSDLFKRITGDDV
jgi:hypothetical protein